jgi:hypothetical protein
MPIKPYSLYRNYHTSELYHLSIKQSDTNTKIIMKVLQGTVNTRELPHTFPLLKKMLPSVLRSTCYNENDDPFYREVQHTEIGHLFEHILIEHLCLLKVSQGYDDVEFSGVTKWNWILHPKGSFHITVSANHEDISIFNDAMEKSIELTNLILQSGQKIVAQSPYQLHAAIEEPGITFSRPN